MNRISIYVNSARDPDLSRTARVLEILSHDGVTLFLDRRFRGQAALAPFATHLNFVSEEELFSRGQVLVTLGGDGTILSVAGRAAVAGLPILGINFGRVGFMAALEEKELEALPRLLTDDFTVSSRMMLSCSIDGSEPFLALNEFVVAPEKGLHIVETSLSVDGTPLCEFRADALIFNTPTGSTGYAFSAGGAVVQEGLDCIGVKAVSSYLLINAHHMIFSPESTFTLQNVCSEGGKVTVCADGRACRELNSESVVTIFRSEKRVQLIRFAPTGNLEVFFRKF